MTLIHYGLALLDAGVDGFPSTFADLNAVMHLSGVCICNNSLSFFSGRVIERLGDPKVVNKDLKYSGFSTIAMYSASR